MFGFGISLTWYRVVCQWVWFTLVVPNVEKNTGFRRLVNIVSANGGGEGMLSHALTE